MNDPQPEGHMASRIGRRKVLATLGGSAMAWPLAARAQQGQRMRRIGLLTNLASDDPAQQSRVLAFAQALAQSGWTEGRNVRIDIRWGATDPERVRRYAAELVALAPDVILAVGSGATGGCCRRRALCRSCSCLSPTRWALASSKPSPGRAATLPVLCCMNTTSAVNGWSCLRRSRPA